MKNLLILALLVFGSQSTFATSFNASVGATVCDDTSWRGRGIIWCETQSSGLQDHHVGRCAQENGQYVGTPIENCEQYVDRNGNSIRTTYSLPTCNDSSVTPNRGESVTEFEGRCNGTQSTNITTVTNDGDDSRTAETVWCKNNSDANKISKISGTSCPDGSSQVTGEQLTALTNCAGSLENIDLSVPNGSCYGAKEQIAAATSNGNGAQTNASSLEAAALNQIKCDLTLSEQVIAGGEASALSPEFGADPFAGASPILASRSSTRGRSTYNDDFEDYEDSDSTGTRDFMKAPMLKFCEDQGTTAWNEFTQGLMGTENAVWDPSWGHFYRRYLLGQAGQGANNGNQSTPAYISLLDSGMQLDDSEKKFINRCKTENTSLMTQIQSSTTTESSKLGTLKKKLKAHAIAGLQALAKHRKKLEKCEALVSLTNRADYDREYESTGRSAKTIKASFDQQLKCETYGPEAQDFKPCVDFINTYDASMVAKTALQAGQGIHYQSERIEDQNSLSQQGAIGGIDHRGALGIQKGEIKDRAGYATQNAALDSAKLAALFGILQSMPNRKKLVEECSATIAKADIVKRLTLSHKKAAESFVKGFGLELSSLDFTGNPGDTITDKIDPGYNPETTVLLTASDDVAGLCEITGKSRSAATLIMNDEFRDTAKRILAQTATEAAASFMAAGMLNKQARQIDELLKRIEGYDPSENFVAPSDALLAGPCAFDPNTPGCAAGIQPVARNVGFGNNSLSIGGGGFGGNGVALDADTGFDDAATGGNVSSDRTGETGPIGSLIPNNNKSGGLEAGGPAAAGVKTSNRGGVSGGGGAGASSVGSTGRGGSGGGAGGSKGGQASSGKSLAYAGSSIGRLSGGRGVGRKPASKDGGANPFANMFKKGGPQNDTLNFRNPAGIGSKSGSIFDRISDRYRVVQGKNLLLEYEEKK